MDSGGSPENCQQKIKISQIDHFGGPSETCQKIVLGSLKIVKQNVNIGFPGQLFYNIFTKYGPKRGAAAEGRDKIFIKILSGNCPRRLFHKTLTTFDPLGEYFLSIFRASSKSVGFHILDNFQTICPGPLRDGPKSCF